MRALSYLLAVIVLAPFVALGIHAVTGPPGGAAAPWVAATEGVVFSAAVGLAVGCLTAALGFVLAYLVTYRSFPGRWLVQKLLVLPLVLPPFVVASLYAELLSPSGPFGTTVAAWVPLAIDFRGTAGFVFCMTISLYPFAYLLSKMAMEEHGSAPFDLGQSLGLDHRQALRRVLLPLCLPGVLLGGGLALMETVGDWATASVLSVRTSSVVLHDLWFVREQPRFVARYSLLLVVAMVALVALVSRRLKPVHLRQALAGLGRPYRTAAPRWAGGWPALLACAVPVVLGFVVPLAAATLLLVPSLRRANLSDLQTQCLHTAALVGAVAVMGGLLAVAITYAARSRAGAVARLLSRFLVLSYLLPVMVFALAVLVLGSQIFAGARYADATAFIILAYAVGLRLLCFLLIPISVGLAAQGERLSEVGRSLGLARARAFARLQLPLLQRFVLVGLTLLALQAMREVALSVVLSPFGFEPIAAKIYSLVRIDLLAKSSPWVVTLAILGIGPLLVLEGVVTKGELRERRSDAAARRAVPQGS